MFNWLFLYWSSRTARFQYDAGGATPRFPDYEARLADQQEMAILAVMNEKEALILQKRKWVDTTEEMLACEEITVSRQLF